MEKLRLSPQPHRAGCLYGPMTSLRGGDTLTMASPKLGVLIDRDDDRAHPVAMGQDDLFKLAAIQLFNHSVQLPHGVADRIQLVVGNLVSSHGPDPPSGRRFSRRGS